MSAHISSDRLLTVVLLSAGGLALAGALKAPSASQRWRKALGAYLTDHHAGSEAALTLLRRLQDDYDDTALGQFLAELERDITDDRQVLEEVIAHIGVSTRALKRAAASMGGMVVRLALSAREGENLALLEALESLALGVQGKRCLWQALIAARMGEALPHGPDFEELERRAVDQAERIERHRLVAARLALTAPSSRGDKKRGNAWRSTRASAIGKPPRTSTSSASHIRHSTPDLRSQKMPPDDKASSRWTT